MMNPLTFEVYLEKFFLITYTPPADRVRPLIPKICELQTYTDEEGVERTWVSTACFFNRGFHWQPAPRFRMNFWQSTYRTYVQFKDHASVFFFATDLETVPAAGLQGFFAGAARKSEFGIESPGEDENFICTTVNRNHSARFYLRRSRNLQALDQKTVQFLTMRPHGLFQNHFGTHMDQIVSHGPMNPIRYELISANFDLWHSIGVLREEEDQHPAHVFMQPEIKFKFFPPLPSFLVLPLPLPKRRSISVLDPSPKRL
jgi:hypothetical protein